MCFRYRKQQFVVGLAENKATQPSLAGAWVELGNMFLGVDTCCVRGFCVEFNPSMDKNRFGQVLLLCTLPTYPKRLDISELKFHLKRILSYFS